MCDPTCEQTHPQQRSSASHPRPCFLRLRLRLVVHSFVRLTFAQVNSRSPSLLYLRNVRGLSCPLSRIGRISRCDRRSFHTCFNTSKLSPRLSLPLVASRPLSFPLKPSPCPSASALGRNDLRSEKDLGSNPKPPGRKGIRKGRSSDDGARATSAAKERWRRKRWRCDVDGACCVRLRRHVRVLGVPRRLAPTLDGPCRERKRDQVVRDVPLGSFRAGSAADARAWVPFRLTTAPIRLADATCFCIHVHSVRSSPRDRPCATSFVLQLPRPRRWSCFHACFVSRLVSNRSAIARANERTKDWRTWLLVARCGRSKKGRTSVRGAGGGRGGLASAFRASRSCMRKREGGAWSSNKA